MYAQKDQHMPLVSVIMPAYNAERFIREAISSVVRQSITEWELIVIDDCSTDESYSLAWNLAQEDSRIIVLQNDKNSGVAKTRNRGIELAKGRYIAFLDSDDIWHPEKLQRQLERIIATGAGICYCSYAIIDSSGRKNCADYLVPSQVTFDDILKENCIQCSAMLIPAEIVKKIMFNTEFFHEDYVLGLDILKNGHTAVACTEILLEWRYLENSRSFDKKKSAKNRWKIYREYLKLPLGRTLYYFAYYIIAGLRKYLSKNRDAVD